MPSHASAEGRSPIPIPNRIGEIALKSAAAGAATFIRVVARAWNSTVSPSPPATPAPAPQASASRPGLPEPVKGATRSASEIPET